MAGQGCLDGDFCRFKITDFSHHDDVRILTEKRPQRGGECQPDVVIDVYLIDAVYIVFYRVLGGHNIDIRFV